MSTPDRISATGQIVLKSETSENNSSSGNKYTRVFTGSKALCQSQKMVEQGFGATLTVLESTGDGNYQLTATYPYDYAQGSSAEKPANVHELEINIESVDVMLSDNILGKLYAAFGGWTGMQLARIMLLAAIDQFKEESKPIKTIAAMNTLVAKVEANFNDFTAPQKALLLNLFRGIAYHNIDHAPQYNTVYQRRITAASYNQVQASFEGAGQIWLTAEVVDFEGVPSAWYFQLPTAVVWLKSPPRVSTVAGQKTEVSYYYTATKFAWSGNFTAYKDAPLITF